MLCVGMRGERDGREGGRRVAQMREREWERDGWVWGLCGVCVRACAACRCVCMRCDVCVA